uniref:Predicted protein n=1 Tax=Hordeum vulgare subsp. vulgare TaxID=112509 RepID=F2E2P0_HORVV|nr:predicted protein [Hordeum vulgare subsp. vulgare]
MKKTLIALLLIALAVSDQVVTTTNTQGCGCDGCSNNGVPVNQPIVVNTPSTIAPPACAIPTINPPVITPPTVNVPVINAPCINVPTLTPPSVIAPPTVTPPTPVIPVVTPPTYTPPSLPQLPGGCSSTLPTPPVIAPPTAPPSNCPQTLSNQFTFTFQYACRPNVAFQSCLGEVVWNNVIVYSVVPSDYSWHSVTLTLTVQSGRNALQFVGAGLSDSYGLLIDNVTLVRQGTTANIVVNGDFSSPNVHGSWGIFNDISGWLGTGIEVGYAPNAYGSGTAQVCELDGNANYEITQYFYFNNQYTQVSGPSANACNNPFPGTSLTYKLEFDWAVRTNGVSSYDTSKGNVLWNNVVIGSLGYNGNTNVNHATFTVTLNSGDNILNFDGTSLSDSYGLAIDNVKLTSVYNATNLIVNGAFSSPSVGSGWNYYNGGILGWSAVRAEVGVGSTYNPAWGNNPVLELDSDSNQRYTQVITISQALYAQLVLQVQQAIGNGNVVSSTNLAINNGQAAVNGQLAAINQAVQCKVSMIAQQFNSYLQNLYGCTNAAIQNVQSNQLVTIGQYSCGSSEWLQYFGQSGELDFTCDSDDSALSSGWCTIISINGKVIHCGDQNGNYHLQVAPCSHIEGTNSVPRYGDRIFWKGTQGTSGNVYVTVATTCNC